MNRLHLSPEFLLARTRLAEFTLGSVGAAVLVFDASARVAWASESALDVLDTGNTRIEGLGLDDVGWRIQSSLDDPTPATCPIAYVLATGMSTQRVLVDSSGRRAMHPALALTAIPYHDQQDEPSGVMAAVLPLRTSLAHREDGHAASQSVCDQSLMAHLLVAWSGQILDWNRRFLDLSGQIDEALVSTPFEQLLDLDWQWVLEKLASGDGSSVLGRTWLTHASGTTIPVVGNFRQIWDASGNRAVFVELLDPAELCPTNTPSAGVVGRASFDRSVVPTLAVTIGGEIVEANHAAAILLGTTVESLRQEPLAQHVSMETESWQESATSAWRGDQPVELEASLRRSIADRERRSGLRRNHVDDGRVTMVIDQMRNGERVPVLLTQLVPCSTPAASSTQPSG